MNSTTTVKSNVVSVIQMALVTENINGVLVQSIYGQRESTPLPLNSNPVAPAIAAPAKTVELTPTPKAETETPKAEPVTPMDALRAKAKSLGIKCAGLPNVKAETLTKLIAAKSDLLLKAKSLGIKFAEPSVSAETLAKLIAAAENKPVESKPATPPAESKPKAKGGKGGKGGFKPKADDSQWHPTEGAAKVIVWKKDRTAQFTGLAVKSISTKPSEKYPNGFKGILFVRTDCEGVETKPGFVKAPAWPVLNENIVKYID